MACSWRVTGKWRKVTLVRRPIVSVRLFPTQERRFIFRLVRYVSVSTVWIGSFTLFRVQWRTLSRVRKCRKWQCLGQEHEYSAIREWKCATQSYTISCSVRSKVKVLWRFHPTRWFKYDRDKLWLVYTQIVPVIFEPPCIIGREDLLGRIEV